MAAFAGLVTTAVLTLSMPGPVSAPRPGPVLETITPAQLGAMNVRLDAALQPVELPDWLGSLGVRLPATVLLAGDAEAAVRKTNSGVRAVAERVLTYATLKTSGPRQRGPTIVKRLVWAVVGTRAAPGSVGGVLPVLWLVDARSGRQLVELTVLGPAPAGGATPTGSGGP